MSNVIEFHRPKPRPAAAPKPAPTFNVNDRNEWVAAVKAVWADPANWRTSKKGNRYIVIDRIGVCVVIEHSDEAYWSWVIRRSDGREPMFVELDLRRRKGRARRSAGGGLGAGVRRS
jgi:hypothetical protein